MRADALRQGLAEAMAEVEQANDAIKVFGGGYGAGFGRATARAGEIRLRALHAHRAPAAEDSRQAPIPRSALAPISEWTKSN